MKYETLELTSWKVGEHSEDAVLRVTLNRPKVRNAFNETKIRELREVFQKEAMEKKVRAVVLDGAGKTFCAGADLNWMKTSVDFTYEENVKDAKQLSEMFSVMNEFPKPLVGIVHGAAIGGGVGLVSVCDIVVADENTAFSLSEVRLGLIPACIGPFVIAKIGASQARALFISAERFKAKRAKKIGLIHEITASKDKAEEKVFEILKDILECGPNALAAAKELVLELTWPERRSKLSSPHDYSAELLAKLRVSDEAQEGVKAFLDKRKPSWNL